MATYSSSWNPTTKVVNVSPTSAAPATGFSVLSASFHHADSSDIVSGGDPATMPQGLSHPLFHHIQTQLYKVFGVQDMQHLKILMIA